MEGRAALAVLALLVLACERKAPGPTECRRFALFAYGVPAEEALAGATRRRAEIRDHVDELTRECLVMPYDRELLRCASETGRTRACRAAFERRRARRGEFEGVR